MGNPTAANRLANSSSAYLRSAAHQPIDWYEYGEEAFDRAKELDRPILLDIGAVWCHWCHVIDRESYDDPEIAQIINENYVPVKVDRDQRPDVDARYQQVVSAMSGQGGWPLTGFLTYDGRLIYGGTYFPKHAMKDLLLKIRKLYEERKADIFSSAELLTDELVERKFKESQPPQQDIERLSDDFLEHVFSTIRGTYDAAHGGFGVQPKFPHFSTLELLNTCAFHSPEDTSARGMLEHTLREMALGGIYDQIAGGFHRYSVDRYWHVPHFEKMAYDNAEALKVYTQAYRLTGNPFFREVAMGIVHWVHEELSDQEHGGFYASQDADIDLQDDGDHFTWSIPEVEAILTPQEAGVVIRYYDLTEAGDMHDRPGRNVLWVRSSLEKIAEETLKDPAEIQEWLESARKKMRQHRLNNRPIPFIDKTLYVNWNGMFLAAWFEASDLLDWDEVRAFAGKTLERLIAEFYQPGKQVLHTTGVAGVLEDYVYFALANLKAYQSTGEPKYLEIAQDVMKLVIQNFEDKDLGGFFDIKPEPNSLGLLKFKRKPVEDSPSSSANAVATLVLIQLYYLTEDETYYQAAEKALYAFADRFQGYGIFVSALALALYYYLYPPLKIELLGGEKTLEHTARKVFYPGKLLLYRPEEDKAEARVCEGRTCLPPVTEPDELVRQMKRER